jgi:hypothetical protein
VATPTRRSAHTPQTADRCEPLAEPGCDRLVELREQVAVASSVTLIDEWPIRTWIAFGCAPSAIARATLVCLRSWNRHASPTASSAGLKWCCQKLDEINGLPARFGNTSESRPGTVNRSTCSARIAAVSREIVIDRIPAAVHPPVDPVGASWERCGSETRGCGGIQRSLTGPAGHTEKVGLTWWYTRSGCWREVREIPRGQGERASRRAADHRLSGFGFTVTGEDDPTVHTPRYSHGASWPADHSRVDPSTSVSRNVTAPSGSPPSCRESKNWPASWQTPPASPTDADAPAAQASLWKRDGRG